jgi:prepilin-type N-terminal cleavage/methylation domain-containing protein
MNMTALRRGRPQRGYSLVELLVVVAIIGVFSLISVPALLNYTRMAAMRSGLRQFTTDLRAGRMRAIPTGNAITVNVYRGTEPPTERASYTVGTMRRQLDKNLYFDTPSMTGFTFMPNGSVQNIPSSGTPGVELRSKWTELPNNHYKIEVSIAGTVRSRAVNP